MPESTGRNSFEVGLRQPVIILTVSLSAISCMKSQEVLNILLKHSPNTFQAQGEVPILWQKSEAP